MNDLDLASLMAKVDRRQFDFHLEALKALSEKDRKFELELMLKYEGRAVSCAYLKKLQELTKIKKQ